MGIEERETSALGLAQGHSLRTMAREMAEHKRLARQLVIQMLFAAPHSLWQLGLNENIHGLRRQYLPKGMYWSGYTQRGLNAIAHRLNIRPGIYPD